jgi:hypothetical protein
MHCGGNLSDFSFYLLDSDKKASLLTALIGFYGNEQASRRTLRSARGTPSKQNYFVMLHEVFEGGLKVWSMGREVADQQHEPHSPNLIGRCKLHVDIFGGPPSASIAPDFAVIFKPLPSQSRKPLYAPGLRLTLLCFLKPLPAHTAVTAKSPVMRFALTHKDLPSPYRRSLGPESIYVPSTPRHKNSKFRIIGEWQRL